MMTILLTVGAILFIMALGVLMLSIARARDGREDAAGFHFQDQQRSKPAQSQGAMSPPVLKPLAPNLAAGFQIPLVHINEGDPKSWSGLC